MPRAILITKREAADLLGVTPSAVQRMMDRGELRAFDTVKVDGRPILHRFSLADVKRLQGTRGAA